MTGTKITVMGFLAVVLVACGAAPPEGDEQDESVASESAALQAEPLMASAKGPTPTPGCLTCPKTRKVDHVIRLPEQTQMVVPVVVPVSQELVHDPGPNPGCLTCPHGKTITQMSAPSQ